MPLVAHFRRRCAEPYDSPYDSPYLGAAGGGAAGGGQNNGVVLVTSASSFVGSHVAIALAQRGRTVVTLAGGT